ncbi:MAG: hypothetical protein GY750_09695 [Lentisphaerae bacterium]|nr:hypothetical protein [Lentisphaerota bacterium]MCP4101684.1 hypothetical protein [Lentisphaerota bacterium]
MANKYNILHENIKDLSENCPGLEGYFFLLGGKIGYCFTLACMWGQAVLVNDERTYFQRLDILTKNYSPNRKLSKIVNEITLLRNHHFNAYENLIISIRAFLDGLLLYHAPFKTSLGLDKVDPDLRVQDAMASARYVANRAIPDNQQSYFQENIRENSPLNKIFDKPFIGMQKDYDIIVESTIAACQNVKAPFFVLFSSMRHAVGLTLHMDRVKIYNSNFMSEGKVYFKEFRADQIKEISDELFNKSFYFEITKDLLTLNISAYVSSNTGNKTFPLLDYLVTREVRTKLNHYGKRRLLQNHHHKKRAKFVSEKLSQIKDLNDVSTFMDNERKLFESKQLRNNPFSHYKNNRTPKSRNKNGAYYRIIADSISSMKNL